MRGSRSILLATTLALAGVGMLATPAHAAPTTERVSLTGSGGQSDDRSNHPALTPDARYVGFASNAANLVAGDTNNATDVFVRDRTAGTTTLVSVSSGTTGPANSVSSAPVLSADGRLVVFVSFATDVVAGDTNNLTDVFVRDVVAGTTTRVSEAGGVQANGFNASATISPNGRYVAWISGASNLVAGDTNGVGDAFVKDLTTGVVVRASVSTTGVQADSEAYGNPMGVSDNGRAVFRSGATNLVAGDTNGRWDTFVRDVVAGTTVRANLDSAGAQTQGDVFGENITANGRYVVFSSYANNLVPGDTNTNPDVFLRDLQAGTTARISVAGASTQANGWSDQPAVSADGRYVVFRSIASNLVAGDTNETTDVFVRDRTLSTTTRVNVTAAGAQDSTGVGIAFHAVANTGTAAFHSESATLVPGDTNGVEDIFVRTK